ncbi:MAG: hypothetical protein MUO22_06060 [Sedimentisphaerales bacterium]|jgi:hypothetical protein|nr:hypothetical protein [Sedimentisphaerales bacterium]
MNNAGILITLLLAFCSGCQAIGVLATPTRHEREIPAEYDLTGQTDKRVLVLVKQPAYLNAQENLRYYMTNVVRENLATKTRIDRENIVSYERLSEFRSSEPDFSLLEPVAIGMALKAEMVLLIVVEDYELYEMAKTGYHKGALASRSVLLESSTGKKLWPQAESSKSVRVGFEFEGRGREVAVTRLAAAAGHCIVRYFYDCSKKKFRIADDKTHISWGDWD